VKCPTCSGRFAERFEELDSLGNWLQVLRCINGHRFDRLKPLPALRVAPLTAPVVAPVYVRQQKKRAECLGCGREMAIQSRGLCGRCLYHEVKAEKESVSMGRKQIRKSAVCRGCEVEKTIMGKGLCGSCYSRERSAEKRAAKASAQPLVQPPAMSTGEGDRIAQPEPSKDGRVILEAPGRSAVIAKRLARLIAVDLPPSSSPPLDGPAIKAIVSSNKYLREIKPGVLVDVYDVLSAWKVTNPALQHLIKKALQAGERGHKSRLEDLDDVVASAVRAREIGNV
jgi:hypothetical protein